MSEPTGVFETLIFDTLIVGAGPAGLTAGYLLTKEKVGFAGSGDERYSLGLVPMAAILAGHSHSILIGRTTTS